MRAGGDEGVEELAGEVLEGSTQLDLAGHLQRRAEVVEIIPRRVGPPTDRLPDDVGEQSHLHTRASPALNGLQGTTQDFLLRAEHLRRLDRLARLQQVERQDLPRIPLVAGSVGPPRPLQVPGHDLRQSRRLLPAQWVSVAPGVCLLQELVNTLDLVISKQLVQLRLWQRSQ